MEYLHFGGFGDCYCFVSLNSAVASHITQAKEKVSRTEMPIGNIAKEHKDFILLEFV